MGVTLFVSNDPPLNCPLWVCFQLRTSAKLNYVEIRLYADLTRNKTASNNSNQLLLGDAEYQQ